MDMKTLLQKNRSQVALVIGNGINMYGGPATNSSWNKLLSSLAKEHLPSELENIPNGISFTEFYDVLELKSKKLDAEKSLQKDFCNLMSQWRPSQHHQDVVNWAARSNSPILTTNFEHTLAEAGSCSLHRTKKGGFTDFYPWESYYGQQQTSDPANEFGIWHINGMQHYHRSVRLGLTHYIGSAERARSWLYQGGSARFFSGKHSDSWKGASSWLQIVFNCPLLIFGLSLGENEVFFRWLLIERAKYFKKFPEQKKDAWYVYTGEENDVGKNFFLEGVGIKPIKVDSYDDIYSSAVWA